MAFFVDFVASLLCFVLFVLRCLVVSCPFTWKSVTLVQVGTSKMLTFGNLGSLLGWGWFKNLGNWDVFSLGLLSISVWDSSIPFLSDTMLIYSIYIYIHIYIYEYLYLYNIYIYIYIDRFHSCISIFCLYKMSVLSKTQHRFISAALQGNSLITYFPPS